tara:strand:+ start:1198 stop:1797 length:600 start_codon:yes stop_codon:yes gene_type:complete
MAKNNFGNCVHKVLRHEGGYVNHPDDPGGITNLGVTKKVYDAWIGKESTVDQMKALDDEDVKPIYEENYWNKIKGDDLPQGLDLCIFDFGVNAGPSRAAKMIQKMAGTTVDGGIGPNSIKAINALVEKDGLEEVINLYQLKRQAYYESLKHFDTFGRGWTARNNDTTEYALEMAEWPEAWNDQSEEEIAQIKAEEEAAK